MATVNKFERDYWLRHRERTLEHKWYTVGRLDILILSISSGGLYVMFEIVKFVKDKNLPIDTALLKYAGILFTVAILSNFVAQIAAYNAHVYESKWTKMKIDEVRLKGFSADKMAWNDAMVKFFNRVVLLTNYFAVLAMIVGISMLVAFNYYYF